MMATRKVLTLVFVFNGEKVLLGLKKRGLGCGKWNGFGGKVEPGETVRQAAVRELVEESGAVVKPEDLEDVGRIDFEFKGDPCILEVHAFRTETYSGTLFYLFWFTREVSSFVLKEQ